MAGLAKAFARQGHDMWSGKEINASPLRHDEVRTLRGRNLDALSAEELDKYVFRSMTTIGGPATFKFFLSRYLAVAIRSEGGQVSDANVLLPRLEEADFAHWPDDQKAATLVALGLWADQRRALDARWAEELGEHHLSDDWGREIHDWVKNHGQAR